MSKARLGICLLFYERLDQTIECLQSLLPSKVKIYILSNGSSKSSREAIERFCRQYGWIKILDSDVNLGCGPGRNYLISHTKEDWLLFIDNDIVVKTPNWLEKFESHVSTYKDTEAFIPRIFIAHENRYLIPISLKINGKKVSYDSKVVGYTRNCIPGGASFINRNLFNRLGLYDEKMFIGFSDFEFSIRGILSGNPLKARLIQDIEFIHRHQPIKNVLDQQATLVRYDYKLLETSFDRILEKHGVSLPSDWKIWVANQRKKILTQQF